MRPFHKYSPVEQFWHKVLFKLSYYYEKRHGNPARFTAPAGDADQVSEAIYKQLTSDRPCMIARYGSTELYCLSNYLSIQKGEKNIRKFISFEAEPWWWIPQRISNMRDYSGFFPLNEENIIRFCQMMMQDTAELDMLGSWLPKEKYLEKELKGVQKVFLPYLEPYYASQPWTRALKNKKVVVVHPFAELIESQYSSSRELLFENPDILPPFSLRTVKAVQSLGGGDHVGFDSWFDALRWMEDEIDKKDYDICIIGCGAYGFPLAAHVKRAGKKALHLGGATQLLFGIKGNRWEDPMYGVKEWGLPQGFYPRLFNNHWIKAGQEFKPANANQVEGACYW